MFGAFSYSAAFNGKTAKRIGYIARLINDKKEGKTLSIGIESAVKDDAYSDGE